MSTQDKTGTSDVSEERIEEIVDKLYNNSEGIITEFLEDGVVSDFKNIPMIVWYNTISSFCALALRVAEIQGNEKLQEIVVYRIMLRVLSKDVPMENGQRDTVLYLYKKLAPTVIDVLIPGKDDCKCCCCF